MRHILSITALAALGISGATQAAILYDSTGSPRYNAPSDTTPLRYNDNSFGDTSRILYDDVGLTGGTSANITSVRFDIVQQAGAPAVNVSGFWSPMEPDDAHDGGPGDGANDDPNSANSLGAPITLAANTTNSDRVVSITFSTPFNTGTLNTTQDPGGLSFFDAGLSFSNTNGSNGWEVADDIDNIDRLWDYKSPTDIDEFSFGNDANGDHVYATMAIQVVGTMVVPEPATIGLAMGVGSMLMARRTRRT